jgi:hypothetical protein
MLRRLWEWFKRGDSSLPPTLKVLTVIDILLGIWVLSIYG